MRADIFKLHPAANKAKQANSIGQMLLIFNKNIRTIEHLGWNATNQAVGSSTSRVAAKNAGFAGGPKGEGTARVISPGAPFSKNSKLAKT